MPGEAEGLGLDQVDVGVPASPAIQMELTSQADFPPGAPPPGYYTAAANTNSSTQEPPSMSGGTIPEQLATPVADHSIYGAPPSYTQAHEETEKC